nr:MAG TPA: hypothetical protein [Caudoviricetes sp.]
MYFERFTIYSIILNRNIKSSNFRIIFVNLHIIIDTIYSRLIQYSLYQLECSII